MDKTLHAHQVKVMELIAVLLAIRAKLPWGNATYGTVKDVWEVFPKILTLAYKKA